MPARGHRHTAPARANRRDTTGDLLDVIERKLEDASEGSSLFGRNETSLQRFAGSDALFHSDLLFDG
jgi:hypothetical protein